MLKYIKHLLIISGMVALPIFLFSGCLKEGNDTIVLPLPDGKIPYSVIPEEMQDSLRSRGLEIHEGLNPDTINGHFVASPMDLHFASDNYQEVFYDLYMSFSGQTRRGLIRYNETQKREDIDGQSIMANVIGEGKDITMYCYQNVFECSSNGDTLWKSKTATVVSGTIGEEGIKNCQYAHIVLDTWAADDYHASPLSKPGTYRIWYDGDGMAKRLTE
ncbi:MAG: hypothetical protein IJ785_01445 [Bacteroidales bacterium]|nr:hypothetical protein [Bacteroidales bacterium]